MLYFSHGVVLADSWGLVVVLYKNGYRFSCDSFWQTKTNSSVSLSRLPWTYRFSPIQGDVCWKTVRNLFPRREWTKSLVKVCGWAKSLNPSVSKNSTVKTKKPLSFNTLNISLMVLWGFTVWSKAFEQKIISKIGLGTVWPRQIHTWSWYLWGIHIVLNIRLPAGQYHIFLH